MDKTRIDKWLWAVRIFKTRTMATDACKAGRVKIGANSTKPSYNVTLDEEVSVKKDGFTFTFKVMGVIEKRVSAPIAQACYINLTPPEEINKYKAWFVEVRDRGAGRPTKRDRRDIDIHKDDSLDAAADYFDFEEFEEE